MMLLYKRLVNVLFTLLRKAHCVARHGAAVLACSALAWRVWTDLANDE